MQLDYIAHNAFTKHVLEQYPKEGCGLVINNTFIPCENIHAEPTKSFRISADQLVIEQEKGKLQAILHSHPYRSTDSFQPGFRPEFPSYSDINHFNISGVPWGIASTDGTGLSEMIWLDDDNRPPLLGRLFIWGTQDCYSLVRDWFMENRKINLYNVPRSFGWWNDTTRPPLILDWFLKLEFKEISMEEATIGDVCCVRYGDAYSLGSVNHCGVITGHNEFLHQPSHGTFSQITRLDKWTKSIAKYLRYIG